MAGSTEKTLKEMFAVLYPNDKATSAKMKNKTSEILKYAIITTENTAQVQKVNLFSN